MRPEDLPPYPADTAASPPSPAAPLPQPPAVDAHEAGAHEVRRRNWRVQGYLPHMATLAGTLFGILAIFQALQARWWATLLALAMAGLFDVFDGRLARVFRRYTRNERFGVELDALSDAIVFGCVPFLVLYLWGLQYVGRWGWIVGTVYVICAILRLARFNSTSLSLADDNDDHMFRDSRFFQGIPTPAGAMCLLLPMMISVRWELEPQTLFATLTGGTPSVWGATLVGWSLVVSVAMVLPFPTFSTKGWRVREPYGLIVFVLIVMLLAALFAFPWLTMIASVVLYVGMIPVAWVVYRHARRRHARVRAARDRDATAKTVAPNLDP